MGIGTRVEVPTGARIGRRRGPRASQCRAREAQVVGHRRSGHRSYARALIPGVARERVLGCTHQQKSAVRNYVYTSSSSYNVAYVTERLTIHSGGGCRQAGIHKR